MRASTVHAVFRAEIWMFQAERCAGVAESAMCRRRISRRICVRRRPLVAQPGDGCAEMCLRGIPELDDQRMPIERLLHDAALDALTAQLKEDLSDTVVIVQSRLPDPFFNSAQMERLAELMDRRRSAQENGGSLSEDEQAELKALVEAELRASAARAAAVVDGMGR